MALMLLFDMCRSLGSSEEPYSPRMRSTPPNIVFPRARTSPPPHQFPPCRSINGRSTPSGFALPAASPLCDYWV